MNSPPLPEWHDLEWVTVAQAATYLQVHPRTITRWIRDDHLPASRLGDSGEYRIRRTDVEAVIGNYREDPPTCP